MKRQGAGTHVVVPAEEDKQRACGRRHEEEPAVREHVLEEAARAVLACTTQRQHTEPAGALQTYA